jgi:hypothetical protein
LGKATSEKESMFDVSIATIISKRRYGMKTEGNLAETKSEMKSEISECLWLQGYKSCTSVEGARSEKMISRIHETYHPGLGCSGSLNPTATVHLVNVGTSYFGYSDWASCG